MAAMPIFEYRCRECGHPFETLVTAGRQPACPTCASQNLDKQISVFAVSGARSQEPALPAGACGRCGDPRGPGACSPN
jgi:putative FmdB family regulatory protein